MKVAEALNERKALKDTLARLMECLEANARVQEGDEPAGCLAIVSDDEPSW